MAKINFDGYGEIEIGKYDRHAAELRAAVKSAKDDVAKADAQWAFLADVLDTNDIRQAVDGDSTDTCDIAKLNLLYTAVTDEIDRPAIEAQMRSVNAQLSKFDIGKVERMMDAFKMLQGGKH